MTKEDRRAMLMERTSESHPLRVDAIGVPDSNGAIGITICPGKKQKQVGGGHWNRDLVVDIETIDAWDPSAVVTLVEAFEMKSLQVELLPELMGTRGFDWFHLPIPDGGVPDGPFEASWCYAGHRLRALLRDGRRVLVHCKGGLGRAGLVAARLLVELGENADRAIARVRESRPGAIETAAQERFLGKLTAISSETDGIRSRIFGCLFGGAVGDAFGYEVEFTKLAEILRRFGKGGLREPILRYGKLVVSDDTQMTLFTLDGLNRSVDALKTHDMDAATNTIRSAYLDWFSTQKGIPTEARAMDGLLAFPELYHDRAAGVTCKSALRAGGHGTVSEPINGSKGCGTVMRTAPIGFLGRWFSDQEIFGLAARASAITHGHPDGIAAGAAMAVIVAACLRGDSIRVAAERALALTSEWKPDLATVGSLRAALDRAEAPTANPLDDVAAMGEGWVAEEALAIGLYSALAGRDFLDVLRIAANHDGDSDSTASIAGQIYGAAYGIGVVPHRWASAIDVWAPMMKVVGQMLEMMHL